MIDIIKNIIKFLFINILFLASFVFVLMLNTFEKTIFEAFFIFTKTYYELIII